MSELELRKHRCCFTGHRPEKLAMTETQVCCLLDEAIRQAVTDGFTTFITGMAKGVDLWAAEIVLRLRKSDSRIKLVCALPHEGFGQHWKGGWTEKFNRVLREADLIRLVQKEFSYSSYQRRNEWMVDRSSRIIAVYNGAPGGTKNTLDYAAKAGVPCVILDETALAMNQIK